MVSAVIFDLDGTLIDTEKYYRIFWPKALAEFGYTLTDEQALLLRSLGRPFAPKLFQEWFGEDFDYVKVRQRRKDMMEECLAQEGIQKKPGVDKLISATMVKEGKPAPDIYLYACEQLGLSPEKCIAVEDSPNGVLSAYRAGLKVIMVPDQTKPDKELEGCLYACVDSLADIPKYL